MSFKINDAFLNTYAYVNSNFSHNLHDTYTRKPNLAMNKQFYTSLIIIFALIAASGLLQGILKITIGEAFYLLNAFIPWYIVTTLVSLTGTIFLLKYFHYRKYRFAFNTGIVATMASCFYAIVLYRIMVSKAMMNYYSPVFFLTMFACLIFAASLITLPARKKQWLRIAGFANGILCLILLSTYIGSIYIQSVPVKNVLVSIGEWATLIGSLIPLLFCFHFLLKRRKVSRANENAPALMLSITVMLVLMSTLTFGFMIISDSYYYVYWGKRNFERTQQLAKLFEAHTFINHNGSSLYFQLLKPLNYDPAKKYPLVVSLPYGGQPGTDKIRQIEGAAAAELLSLDSNRQKYPAFLFIPHCPPGAGWGGVPNYPAVDSLVYEAILSLDQQYGIDVKRRYVTGISRGGYGTWHFISTWPDLFAAAIPVCGAGDPALARKIVNVPVWAFHGKHDKNVPVSGSRAMIEAIRAAGGHPKYTEFSDKAHSIWYEVTMTPGLLDWLFAQQQP